MPDGGRMPLPSAQRKIASPSALARLLREAKRRGRRVVFTNGCFDLVHAGHVKLLERAKRLGDVLVVALNSDRSVRTLKGAARPIIPQQDRALLIAALACVDYVTIFDERTPERLITRLQPNVLVKGADWGRGRVVGREVVERHGGRVVRIPLLQGHSTTSLIERIRALP